MVTMRTYCDACAAAHALDLVGERWALLVVRELLLGPKRFTDLRAGLPNASPNVLAQRLRELERAGIVRRRKLAPPAASRVYELTEWGEELEAVIISLGRWGARSPSKPRDAELGVDSLILSLRTMFDPGAAEGLEAVYELRFGEDRFRAVVRDGRFEVERGSVERPDATIEGDPATLASLV
jgi:DNA-binding HxlR family transcriptional regulator